MPIYMMGHAGTDPIEIDGNNLRKLNKLIRTVRR